MAMWRCRVTGRLSPVRHCQCIPCVEQRTYRRQWARDQFALGTAYAVRKRERIRRLMNTEPYKSRSLARLARWKAEQSELSIQLYDSLRRMARRDKLKEERCPSNT